MIIETLFLLLAAANLVDGPGAAAQATIAAMPTEQVASRGAAVPFIEFEAEDAQTNGLKIGPDRTFGTLASEASGRRAVLLRRTGEYVAFTLTRPANALTIRYAIPDSGDGRGLVSTIGLYANGKRLKAIEITSRYGWFYGKYPFSNNPNDGAAHHFYDESRVLLGRTLEAGTEVRLMGAAHDDAPWVAIDLADFEWVPPPKRPPVGALSIVKFGADPTGRKDSWPAISRAISVGKKQRAPVWIPPGTFRINRHLVVDRVTVAGAGAWYSTIQGNGAGIYGRRSPHGSQAVVLRDFAIVGDVRERVDKAQLAGIGGTLGGGSLIEDLWLQHHKVGIWLDGPLDGVTIRRLRIVDHAADGINLSGGVTNALVEQTFVRNSGDDGLAMWSRDRPNRNNRFLHNTVVAPVLANGIAIYGGGDAEISGNVVADTVTQGGGIHLGNRFKALPLSGRIEVKNNLVVRSGSFDPNWGFGVGAIWFYALDSAINAAIDVSDTDIADSTLPALQTIGKPIAGLAFDDIRIMGTGSAPVQLQSEGTASFRRVVVSGTNHPRVTCDHRFNVVDKGQNQGWALRC